MEDERLGFYRCVMCKRVVSIWDIKDHHGCKVCGNPKISPTNLSFFEELVQIAKHPKVWTWKHEKI